jgi:hypothetical protein
MRIREENSWIQLHEAKSLRICPMRSSTHLNSILIYIFLFFGHANRSNLLALSSLMIFFTYTSWRPRSLILNQSIKQSSTRLSRVSRIDTAATQQRWQQSSVGSSHVTYLTCRTRLLTEGDSAAQAICHVSKFMENRLGHASPAPRFRQVLVYCNILNLLLILSDN